jgi:two-component system, OmpR family, heavy metal sensor histidine kinase CusS
MTLRHLTLTARLTVLFTLVGATVLLGLGILVAWATEEHFVDLDRTYLEDKLQLLDKLVSESDGFATLSSRLDQLLDSHRGLYIALLLDDETLYGSKSFLSTVPPAVAEQAGLIEWRDPNREYRAVVTTLALPDSMLEMRAPGQDLRVLVAIDTEHHVHFMHSLRGTLAIYLLFAMAVSGLLGWWAAHRGLAPLKVMRDKSRSISAHNIKERMPVESVPVEFAELANSLNAMLDRLEHDFQRLMDFSSDLAHELRTPISNLLTQTQVALSQKRSINDYCEVLASNAEEFEQLGRMVSDMLFLAKTENGIDLPHPERIQLQKEVAALFDFYEAVAKDKGIQLQLRGEAEIDGDRLMIRRAISNLLSNALRHADPDSIVRVEISSSDGAVVLSVGNRGKTIPATEIPRLFDRFYRIDKSRAHPDSDGTGLGLAITKAIMEAHGGGIAVESAGNNTHFRMRFRAIGIDRSPSQGSQSSIPVVAGDTYPRRFPA